MPSAKCTVCGTIISLTCTECKAANYCSVDCQIKDKPPHDLLCSKFVKFLDNEPKPHNHLALFSDQNTPHEMQDEQRKFIWVETRSRMTGGKVVGHSGLPMLGKWLGSRRRRSILHTLNNRTIEISEVEEDDDENAGVSELIEGGYDDSMMKEACPKHFGASLVIMGVESVAEDGFAFRYRDLTLDDFRIAFHCFLEDSYVFEVDDDEGRYPHLILSQPQWLEVVKISNDGEVRRLHRNRYRQMMLNKDHWAIDRHSDKSEITERMGIGFLFVVWPKIVEPYYRTEDRYAPNVNSQAIYMLLGTDTSGDYEDDYEHWGKFQFPKYDNENDPSFIIFRKDKKGITKHQVEALSEYSGNVMYNALLDHNGMWDQKKKGEVLDHYFSAQKFKEFFENFKQEKIQSGDKNWIDATVPTGVRRHTLSEALDHVSKRNREASPTPANDTNITEDVSVGHEELDIAADYA